jgi:transcriptional regulator with PAS, ATPase and Fis domain
LYHDNIYSEADFAFSPDTLNQIGRNLGIYVRRIQQYCRQMEEKTLVAIRETTSNAQLDDRNIICQSRTMHELLAQADKAAAADAPVLILGETGVGKELLARRLHDMSSRNMGPFVAVNLSAIPEMLLESELFGHEKGAFTGAVNQKPGRMELANRGTLFVDEIGEIPLSLQVKLLRVLEEKVFFRVGGVKSISSNFRLVAATNRDLIKEIGSGNFREDLYYRLNVVPLVAPPLRMRGNDIILLAEYFLDKYSRKYQKNLPVLTPEDQALLKAYRWPGNVRELQNVIERTVVLSDGGGLNLMIPRSPDSPGWRANHPDSILSDMPTMDEMQRRYILLAIKKSNGKMSGKGGASEILGMTRTTLYTRMKKLGISPLSDE